MGRLIISLQTTLDGVMDRQDKWFSEQDDVMEHGIEELRAAEAVLLGRETFEAFLGFWPSATGTYADIFNPMPKHVASRTLSGQLDWNATLLEGDATDAVAALKQELDGPLISYGCGELASTLARAGLVDEVRFWLHPLVWGEGLRAFSPGELPVKLRLITAAPYLTGVVRLSYEPVPG